MNDFEEWNPNEVQLVAPSIDDLPEYDGDEEYQNIKALSWSRLNRFISNPYYYKRNPEWKIESKGFEVGSYIHRMILEHDKYANIYRYFDAPLNIKTGQPYKSGKAYNDALQEFIEQGYLPKTDEMVKTFNEVVASIKDSGVNKEFAGAVTEIPIIGELCGIKVKGKIDAYSQQEGIIDLKTTSSPLFTIDSSSSFYYKCRDYGYIYELAYFASIVESTTGQIPPCKIVAVQTTEPYQVGVFQISSKQLIMAMNQIKDEFLPLWKKYEDGDLTAMKKVIEL